MNKATRSFRIVLTADPELPVPPLHYGGIERIIDMLARGLVERGHNVTVFAHKDSQPAGRMVAWPGRSSRSHLDTLQNSLALQRYLLHSRIDVLHSFSRLAYLGLTLPLRLPKLMTYQRKINRRSALLGHRLSRGTLWFSAISRWMMRDVEDIGTWRLVFNGVPLGAYEYRPDPGPDAPLVFLGRVEEIKGPHLAIQIAQRTRLPLVIAGNVPTEHRGWFETTVEPHLDGTLVSYVGPVNDAEKNQLLGRARALIMPVLWEEPFGIVMAEAMACGTPVLGLARGAVVEVVEHGVTGFVSEDIDGLVDAIPRLHQINRAACRARVERLFSQDAVVDSYLDVYREMLVGTRRKAPA